MDNSAAVQLSSILNALNEAPSSTDTCVADAVSAKDAPQSISTSFGENRSEQVHVVEWEDAEYDGTLKFSDTESRTPRKVTVLPVAASSRGYKLLQLWEGVVESVEDDSFTAVIADRTNPDAEDEIAEFSFDDVAPDDQSLVREGALFIWSIAYEITGGTRYRKSEIRFRRMGVWTKTDLKKVQKTADSIGALLGLSGDSSEQYSSQGK